MGNEHRQLALESHPENAEQWKTAFQHAAAALKRGGPNLRVQWVPNSGVGNSLPDATQVYPREEFVDVIGVDAYDWSNQDTIDGKGGVAEWANFARQHGKQLSLPEWGVHRGDDGGGDDPQFVTRMTDTLKRNADIVAFASYFDEPEDYIANFVAEGQVPRAAAALRESLSSAAGRDGTPPSTVPSPSPPGLTPTTSIPPEQPNNGPTTSARPEPTDLRSFSPTAAPAPNDAPAAQP